jgi:predicted Rossmann fold flavoprotein
LEGFDVVVVGAGAAGMMCAIEAGKRGRRVLVIDHAKAAGEKIHISGGGRCNFTNLHTAPEAFISQNPRFCISALRRYPAKAFIALIEQAGVAYHEKALGQLFCDGSAREIIDLLLGEMERHGVVLRLSTTVQAIEKTAAGFSLVTSGGGAVACQSLVIATGGKSIPKMGATGFGYEVARQFGLGLVATRPALVPLTFEAGLLERLRPLAGVATDVVARAGKARFAEAMLFTHRGLSGPAILQISSYWREGEEIEVDMAPGVDLFEALRQARGQNGRQSPRRWWRNMSPNAWPSLWWRPKAFPGTSPTSRTGRFAKWPTRSTAGGSSRWAPKAIAPPRSPWAGSTPRPWTAAPWPPRPLPASISSARWWMSPAGWGAIISNGPGPAAGAPAKQPDA